MLIERRCVEKCRKYSKTIPKVLAIRFLNILSKGTLRNRKCYTFAEQKKVEPSFQNGRVLTTSPLKCNYIRNNEKLPYA